MMIAPILNSNFVTPGVAVEDAEAEDVDDLTELLESCLPYCSPETIRELPRTWRLYRIVRDEWGAPVAAGALTEVGDGRLEIRGLAVASRARGRGLARAVLEDLLEGADALEGETLCVTRCPSFFARFGFEESVESEWCPERGETDIDGDAPERVAMCRPTMAGALV